MSQVLYISVELYIGDQSEESRAEKNVYWFGGLFAVVEQLYRLFLTILVHAHLCIYVRCSRISI